MNKTSKRIAFAALLLLMITACNLFVSSPQKLAETPTPTQTARPTETVTPTASPSASATPAFAPICAPDLAPPSPSSQCQMPIAEESSAFCADKKPYTLLLVNKNAVYKSQTQGIKCTDQGVKDGKVIVACTGKMATDFEVLVCDSACAVPTVQAENTQCSQGYFYNSVQGCCAQELEPVNQNCVSLKLKTTSCVVKCRGFTKSACNNTKNSNSCIWNKEDLICETRK